jgi:O-antigen/teichoic acid export membrane protein
LETDIRWIFFSLLLAMLADSTSEFLNVGYRVTNRFSTETRLATVSSISQFAIVVGAVWRSNSIPIAASAFLVSRLLVLVMTWLNQRQYFSQLKPASISRAVFRLRQGMSYAFDFGLQSLIGQIDSIILNHFLGPVAVGLHQAGMRIFLGGTQIANVLGNVFIPRIAGIAGQEVQLQREAQRLQTAFFCAGAIFGLTLAGAADSIVRVLFGSQFSALASLLPWFGLLFLVRFFAAAYGVLLTAVGKQTLRAKANLIHWVLIVFTAWGLVPRFGNLGWLLALTAGNLLLGCIYFVATRNLVMMSRLNACIVILGLVAFFPFLSLT